ncbi:phage major capsid protein [Orenia metallireducens]|uniref:phage major capsid protein n=1 Tax=Orenia metallireducens TaxID=1413210 RepID=UPI001C40092B|nr:phage major capsid protein [Orenia metallireducens]
MTKAEYFKTRNAMMTEAQNLIDSGDVESANAKMEEIEELDEKYDNVCKAKANMEALKDNTTSEMDNIVAGNTETVEIAGNQNADKEKLKAYGSDLKMDNIITVGTSKIVIPERSSSSINGTFNEVSSLIDRVDVVEMQGGESFKQPYIKGYGEGGYTGQGADYTDTETVFDYAEINKAKITAYAEHPEEIERLPEANYATMQLWL